jgi:S-adenosylmethionine:tRNA ribosyltransferase-isomerase
MRTDDLDYDLPEELIAARPTDRRDAARLLVVNDPGPTSGQTDRHRRDPADLTLEHRRVRDLPDILRPGDLLVFNDTRVLPARFFAVRQRTGGRVEGLFIEALDHERWHVMLRSGGRLGVGDVLVLSGRGDSPPTPAAGGSATDRPAEAEPRLELLERMPDGAWLVRKHSDLDTETLLERFGRMPLPPYIERRRQQQAAETTPTSPQAAETLDRQRYQTVYARSAGAVAAPTAGLHFTDELLQALEAAEVEAAWLTLHVGLGTFQPVRTETLDQHPMHRERFRIPAATIDAVRAARRSGRRIIPVGTTSVRALESLPEPLPRLADHDAFVAETDLLIQPGFRFRFTDGLMTNFHLPRSTLIALVAARIGLDALRRVYREAIAERYRFYSYGDAMLILPTRSDA